MGLHNKASQQGITAATFYATLARKSSSERRKAVRQKREAGIKESTLLSAHNHVERHGACSTHVMCPYEQRDEHVVDTWLDAGGFALFAGSGLSGGRESYSMAVHGGSTDIVGEYRQMSGNNGRRTPPLQTDGIYDVSDGSDGVTMTDVSDVTMTGLSENSDVMAVDLLVMSENIHTMSDNDDVKSNDTNVMSENILMMAETTDAMSDDLDVMTENIHVMTDVSGTYEVTDIFDTNGDEMVDIS